jgi:hypothetical protein
MPKIEIKQGDHKTGAMSGYGVRVWADGVELQELRNVEVRAHVDAVVEVRVEQLVTDNWSFTHDHALLRIAPILLPSQHKLVSRVLENGDIEWRALPLTLEELKEATR